MTAGRVLEPEILDGLAPDDPAARRARADLRRVHFAMGSRTLLLRTLRRLPAPPRRVLELGAGDGTLLLRVARALAARWPGVELVLLDRQPLLAPETAAAYASLGWDARPLVVDLHDWLGDVRPPPLQAPRQALQWDLVVVSLFLHHLDDATLARLFERLSTTAGALVALEPRRGTLPLLGSRLIGALGVNAVTRADAVASVRAGFAGRELTRLWPTATGARWALEERRAGPFAHLFAATRAESSA